MPKKTQYEHKLEYNNTYNRTNYRSFSVRFNNQSEKDMIEWLEAQDSLKGYLTKLITSDMKKAKRAEEKKAARAAEEKAARKKKR